MTSCCCRFIQPARATSKKCHEYLTMAGILLRENRRANLIGTRDRHHQSQEPNHKVPPVVPALHKKPTCMCAPEGISPRWLTLIQIFQQPLVFHGILQSLGGGTAQVINLL